MKRVIMTVAALALMGVALVGCRVEGEVDKPAVQTHPALGR